jgi:SAM-dependent methyltransferase
MNKNETFLKSLQSALAGDNFLSCALHDYRGSEADLKKFTARPVLLKTGTKISVVWSYKTRDITKNLEPNEFYTLVEKLIQNDFRGGVLKTVEFDLEFPSLKSNPPSMKKENTPSHDRAKNRHLETMGKPYLHALGITDQNGIVLKTAQDKFRQIDKFIEIFLSLQKELPQSALSKIIDMGCGKGYLTFALYDVLSKTKPEILVEGVELRPALVRDGNTLAKKSRFSGLSFVDGDIATYNASGVDALIALHACDTATDGAIAKGVATGARLIVLAPCCHKQIRSEMEKSNAAHALASLTRHGIFLERQAEMVTDSLRALLLEKSGYRVKVFEFISMDHTAKNIMITAVKHSAKIDTQKIDQKIHALKEFFGIETHFLETLLG